MGIAANMISMVALIGAIELGLIYALMTMGLFLSYRILDIADLTVDGSFTLGAAVTAIWSVSGHPLLGLFLGFLAGMAAGMVTAFLQTVLQVQSILAGILTMTALYSINLITMGGSANIPLLGSQIQTIYTCFDSFITLPYSRLILNFIVCALVSLFMVIFLRTQMGLSIRATGDNADMVRSSSINPNFTKTVGLALANAMVALSGGLLAQYQLFADISMGTGMVVIGLASLIIGETLLTRKNIYLNIAAVVTGSILYRIIMAIALKNTSQASHLKLISTIIVAVAISYPVVKEKIAFYRKRKEAYKDA